jgi:hypothetical protein
METEERGEEMACRRRLGGAGRERRTVRAFSLTSVRLRGIVSWESEGTERQRT